MAVMTIWHQHWEARMYTLEQQLREIEKLPDLSPKQREQIEQMRREQHAALIKSQPVKVMPYDTPDRPRTLA